MRASASQSKKENTKALLHYTIDFVGGFLGVYPVLFVAKTFASAQTANVVNMMVDLADLNLPKVLLRFFGFFVFSAGVVLATWLPKHIHHADLKKLAIYVDLLDCIILILLPEETIPLLAVLPNFFTMAFQWSCFPGVYGYNSATIFITNNTKQTVSAWTEVYLNHDDSFRLKFEFYGISLLCYAFGVFCCALCAHLAGKYASLFCFIPLLFALYTDHRIHKMSE